MNRLVKYFGYTLFLPFWWLQLLIPRNKNIWIFGAWYGKKFSDNSKYLFQYIRDHDPSIQVIWLTRNKSVCNRVRELGGKSYLTNSVRGIFYSLAAQYVVVSSGKKDISYLFINGSKTIQLWHGNPMKKIGLDDKFSKVRSAFQQQIVRNFFPFAYECNFDYVVSNAKIFSEKMSSAFDVPLKNVLETGCPRNDVFFEKQEDEVNKRIRDKFQGCRLIYYLPTFRSQESSFSLFNLPDYNETELEEFLLKENLVFISKGHFIDKLLAEPVNKAESRIINLSDETVEDINYLLKDADLLITDYSGAYFDFLLTERPIIFAAFDLDKYVSGSRELYFEYENIVAGPIVKNWEGVYNALQFIWVDNSFSKLVKEKNIIFNKYHDNNNSKRVFEKIKKI